MAAMRIRPYRIKFSVQTKIECDVEKAFTAMMELRPKESVLGQLCVHASHSRSVPCYKLDLSLSTHNPKRFMVEMILRVDQTPEGLMAEVHKLIEPHGFTVEQ